MCVFLWLKRILLLFTGLLGGITVLCLLVQYGSAQQRIAPKEMEFPIAVPGTTLVMHELVLYEGGYLEDSKREHVENVAAILMENVGQAGIEHARVRLFWDGGYYVFEAEMLPGNSSVIALEKNKQEYMLRPWTGCDGMQKTAEGTWWIEGVQLENVGACKLRLTNISDHEISDLQLFFKDKVYQQDILLGGSTHCVNVGDLLPGDTVLLSPYRFVWEYSQVVCIRQKTLEKGGGTGEYRLTDFFSGRIISHNSK